jgi:hypothetical protein
MPAPTTITVPQLSRLIGLPDAPTLVDVRIDDDYRLILGCCPVRSGATIAPSAVGHPNTGARVSLSFVSGVKN